VNREQAFLNEALPYLQAICREKEDVVITTGLSELRAKKLSPDRAMYLWMELNAIRGVLKSLETRIKLPKETGNG